MKNYLIKDIPDALWLRARHLALDDGVTMRVFLIEALTCYVEAKEKEER